VKPLFKKIVVRILTAEARAVLRRRSPKIVAITGSVGKTSTKDAIFAVMSEKFFVRKSAKSFNSELGVPLTILGLQNAWSNPLLWLKNILEGAMAALGSGRYPQWLVLEVGADHPGDIKNLTEWLRPDITVITRLPEIPVHVEFFPTPDAIKREKAYLAEALKRDGTLVLNFDDDDVMTVREYAPDNALVTYGFGAGADMLGSLMQIRYDEENSSKVPRGTNFRVDYQGKSVPVHVYGSLGAQHVYPALAAMAVGASLGLNMIEMAESLGKHRGPQGRMRILDGVKGSVLIDDTYNSSPVALHQALDTLQEIEVSGKKYAVLGDMLELGKYSIDEHRKAGKHAAEVADVLLTVGVRARDIAAAAMDFGMAENNIFQYENSVDAGKELDRMLEKGDIALIKGSQGIRMEKTVFEVIADPDHAKELLVRQDAEWENR
jgi:UDP-N-acetylmuramoyl-tripeptide--D-alanyl-D-alanine ligase